MPDKIQYPPDDLLKISAINYKRNYEFIILWMLNNNKECRWMHFISKPLNIIQSTLSNNLKKLLNKEFITKTRRNGKKDTIYTITSKGKVRYNELSIHLAGKPSRELNFPVKKMINKRNYGHIILWMLYNNSYCEWNDFLRAPISIPRSSLSKAMNSLIQDGLVKREVKNLYTITSNGKIKYSNMLKSYDLDRQTILEEESRRIEKLTKSIMIFLEKFEINEENIHYNFLNNYLKLDYSKVERLISEEAFKKILLYISMNHPNNYPYYISIKEFAQKYNIEERILNYYIPEITHESFYPAKFFKLEPEKDGKIAVYYLRVDDGEEQRLRTIVENRITKYSYLKALYKNSSFKDKIPDLLEVLNEILDEICGYIFHDELRGSLEKFLPDYINYLAYIIETKKIRDYYKDYAFQRIPENLRLKLLEKLIEKSYKLYGDLTIHIGLTEINDKVKGNPEFSKKYLIEDQLKRQIDRLDIIINELLAEDWQKTKIDSTSELFKMIKSNCEKDDYNIKRKIAEALPSLYKINFNYSKEIVQILRKDWDEIKWKSDNRRRTIESLSSCIEQDKEFVKEQLNIVDGDEIYTIIAIVETLSFWKAKVDEKEGVDIFDKLIIEMKDYSYSSDEINSINEIWTLLNVINSDPEKAIIDFNALKDSENIFIQITIARNLINFCQNYPEKVLELMQYFLSVKEKRNLRRPIAKENSLSCLISLMLKSNYADTAKRIIWNLMTDNDLIIRQTAFDRMERILQIDNEFGLQILDQIRSQEKDNDILKRAAIISSKMSL